MLRKKIGGDGFQPSMRKNSFPILNLMFAAFVFLDENFNW